MNYIKDFKKYSKIRELAKNGDQDAINFLISFTTMNDDDVNNYLDSIQVDEEQNISPTCEIVNGLIEAENHSIETLNQIDDETIIDVINEVKELKNNIVSKLQTLLETGE